MLHDGGFSLTDHACRVCLGRILERDGMFVCAICGAEAQGVPDAICGCGLRARDVRKTGGFRCAPNPQPTPANPARVVIMFGDTSVTPAAMEDSHV